MEKIISSHFTSPESEKKAKELFKIASDAILEIINVSGSLNKKDYARQ